jgi:hypothetical protein
MCCVATQITLLVLQHKKLLVLHVAAASCSNMVWMHCNLFWALYLLPCVPLMPVAAAAKVVAANNLSAFDI